MPDSQCDEDTENDSESVTPTTSAKRIIQLSTNSTSLAEKSQHLTNTGASTSGELLFTPQSTGQLSNNLLVLSDRELKEQILSRLLKQEQVLNNILTWINSQNSVNTPSVIKNIQLPIVLPISTVDDFYKLEDHLKDENNFKAFCIYLSCLGGKTGSPRVNKILKTVITFDVASNFNFCGSRGNKIAFQNTELKKAVVKAIKHACAASTDKEIEDFIKNWLKHAQRLKPQGHGPPLNFPSPH